MGEEEGAQRQGLAARAKTVLGLANKHRGKLAAVGGALGFLGRRRQKQAQARKR